MADFKDDDPIEYDQYGMVHLAFCGACPDSLMKELCKSTKLVNKVLSFIEINMDFSLIVDNAFLVKVKPYQTKIPDETVKNRL